MTPQWAITVPRSVRLPGLRMAAFTGRTPEPVELVSVAVPAVILFLDLGDATVRPARGADVVQGSGAVGIGAGPLRVLARDLDCVQLRLSPPLAYAALGGALAELVAGPVPLDAIWGSEARRLRERLHDQADWDHRFAVIEAALGHRCRSTAHRVDTRVAAAWQILLDPQGIARVDRIAAEVGCSRKVLWARFRSQLGITPKRAAALARFDRAAHLLAAGHSAARVAADCGYADQSHLNRDTAAIAGLTPVSLGTAPWLQVDPVAWPSRQPSDRRAAG